MNKFLNGLEDATNFIVTENGAISHRSTKSDLLDMFALGAAMRSRSVEDVILMFKKAYEENPTYALKCLFYIGDCRGGQGERRFFRVCIKWLANNYPDVMRRNIQHIPTYRRWDDLYALVGTPLEVEMFAFIKEQLALDLDCKTPSLLAKWLKSENTSSKESCRLGNLTRAALGMNHKQYRKTLAHLRTKINVLEKLMSENRWDEIEFDKIPSKAGLIYKNAFARHDIERAKAQATTYAEFARNKDTKVNAAVLNPVDIASQIFGSWNPNETERLMWDKYWANLKDYYNGREENGIAVVDVSGSMSGTPLHAAVSMGAYIAERGKGPFANHFITFSGNPQLVKFEGIDLYDKFQRAEAADWGMNTNIEATMDLLLTTAINNHCSQEEMPSRVYIFSDMEFDRCAAVGPATTNRYDGGGMRRLTSADSNTYFESLKSKWAQHGYKLPNIIFWNLRSAQDNIPAIGEGFSYVSGFSMNMIECILSGKDGYDLMMDKLNTERYTVIQ